MRAALRRSPFLVLLTTLTTVALLLPLGLAAQAAEVGEWVPTANGKIRITSVTPEQRSYSVGDVVTLRLRMESNAAAPKRDITVTSDTVSNSSSCDWNDFPGATAGKYDCSRPGKDPLTYTVTEADLAAGEANPSLTFTETPVGTDGNPDGTAALVTTIGTTLPVAVPVTQLLEVALTRTDDAGEPVHPGDTLTFDISYRSLADRPITAFPRTSNLNGVLADVTPNCRYENLPSTTKVCTTATHTVTVDDLAAGGFTPTVTFDATSDREGTTVLQAGITAELPAITVEAASTGPRPVGEYVALASSGDFGYACHRIPALTQAPNGDILASWDGRPGGCADAPQANSIIQRRSTDGGQTWGPVTTIAAGKPAAPKYGYSDPSYVVDRETGHIFNFFVKSYDVSFQGSEAGTDPDARNVLHAAVTMSQDNGFTWSVPEVITAAITDEASWISRFAASGEGIQLRYGPNKGRLLQQFTIKDGGVYKAMSVYSDDHGATWDNGEPVGSGMDENKVVELSDGRVMLNSRPSTGATLRKVAISTDGGLTYGEVTTDPTLIDPRNNASIIRAYPDATMGSAKAKVLLFSNSATQGSRSNGTIRISFDDGQTWSGSKVFEPGSMSYSTLTPLAKEGTYGLLFEGANTQIRYMTISLDWLGVAPIAITAEPQTVNRGDNTVSFTATNVGAGSVTFTPSIAVPQGWAASDVAPVTLAAGATGAFATTITVPDTTDPGDVVITAAATLDGRSTSGTANLTVALLPGQNPTEVLGVTVLNEPPAQPGLGIDKAFDGDIDTLWHTTYGQAVTMPVDVDMVLGDAPVDVTKLEYVPRSAGGDNGRINGYEIWAGNDLDALAKLAEGNFANTPDTKTVLLSGSHQFLRLRTLSSYGVEGADKYVSAAEIRVRVAVPDSEVPPTPTYLSVSLDRTDSLGSPVEVGDELTFQLIYTNPSSRTVTALPRTSTLSGVLPATSPNCRWVGLAAGETQRCTTATHTVTAADLAEGSFTPSVSVDATADAAGTEILQAGIVATLPAIEVTLTVKPTVTPTVTPTVKPTPAPSATPTKRPVNVYTDPGFHAVNGREWFTRCEPYSRTTRCFTSIWASQVKPVNGTLQWVTGWAFNNLTYLPMNKETWKGNKLAYTNQWTSLEGRLWKTECDTAATGRKGCRSHLWTTVYVPTSVGATTFRQDNRWVFNNIVLFN